VIGSTAAVLHGVELRPGDLDIAPALDRDNLEPLAAALDAAGARPDPDAPFGDWQEQPDGERRWVEREPRQGEREARSAWAGDPGDPGSFDHQFATSYGALDAVPEPAGTYADLVRRAACIQAFDTMIVAERIDDILASITVPRRPRDRERVRALRALQRASNPPSSPSNPGRVSSPFLSLSGAEAVISVEPPPPRP
jgi:hypothetical protein